MRPRARNVSPTVSARRLLHKRGLAALVCIVALVVCAPDTTADGVGRAAFSLHLRVSAGNATPSAPPASSRAGTCASGYRLGRAVASLPRTLLSGLHRKPVVGLGAGVALVGLTQTGGARPWICRELPPLRALRQCGVRALSCVLSTSTSQDRQTRELMAYRKMPSVVTWCQPRCFLQGRKKELLLQSWVSVVGIESSAEEAPGDHGPAAQATIQNPGDPGTADDGERLTSLHREDGKTLFAGLGCNETEFRLLLAHVTGNVTEAEGAPISERYIDIGNEAVRADLRHRWTSRRLVLKDKSFKKSMAFDESLVGDVKGYLTRMSEFQNETMAAHELLEWLRAAWAPSSSPSSVQPGTDSIPGSPPGAVAERQPADCGGLQEVAELRFQSHRTIDETGQALGSMLQWFRGAYPYYHQKCLACGSDDTTRCGTLRSSAAEEAFKAGRTEIYHCPDCSAFSRFARYNELRKVLAERRGRCGEYSMVFYHLMLALGYRTRWVVDWTDHVWVEVLIEGAWVHIDPCEAAYNDKKMYVGWGKKHTYVVAFESEAGGDDAGAAIVFEDVTADYAANMTEVRDRRDLSDADLDAALSKAVAEWNGDRDPGATLLARLARLGGP